MCSSLYLGFVTVFQFVISGVTFQRIFFFFLSRYSHDTSLILKVVLFVVISRMFYPAQKFSTEDLFLGRKRHFWLSQLDHGCCRRLTMNATRNDLAPDINRRKLGLRLTMRCVTVFMYLLLEVLQSLERNLDLSNMCAPSLLFKTKLGFVYDRELCMGHIDRWN